MLQNEVHRVLTKAPCATDQGQERVMAIILDLLLTVTVKYNNQLSRYFYYSLQTAQWQGISTTQDLTAHLKSNKTAHNTSSVMLFVSVNIHMNAMI